MDGIGILILGGMFGIGALAVCLAVPWFKRFALGALLSPFAASIVFLIGLFVIADMNPALEAINTRLQATSITRPHSTSRFGLARHS